MRDKLPDIKLIVYDFDGVMTDNTVIVDEDGKESVVCSRADGLAVAKIKELGIPQVIISSEENKVVVARAAKLKMPVIHGVADKKAVTLAYCAEQGGDPAEVVYIGNDVNDLEAMLAVGWPVCPKDACREVRQIAKIVLPVDGGKGVVRALLNYLTNEED